MTKTRLLTATAVFLSVLALLPLMALAQGLAPVANGAIDQAQPSLAEWISASVTSGVMLFFAWLGRRIGIKIVERMNREAIATATRNFANFMIDELQLRFLGSDSGMPDLSDLIEEGLDYVGGGAKDAIKESEIEADRLRAQVEGALLAKGAELRAGAAPVRP